MPRRHSAPLPDFIPPQLAQLADSAPEGDAWLHEVKIDGYRVAASIAGGKVRMFTRRANDWTPRFRPIAAILAELPVKAAYLDGEVAVLTAEGVSDFGALQETLGRRGGSRELVFIAFDLLHLDGRDLRRLPLIERKAMLAKLLAKLPARSPIPVLRPRDRPGSRVLCPRLQAPPGGDYQQARGRTISIRPR
jgi:bifunctional non-homologous end joining protein LigD